AVREHLAAGQSVVLQLVTTAESILDRRLGTLSPDERVDLEIDLSPRELVLSGSPDNTNSLQSGIMSSGSRAGADFRVEDIDSTPDN
ncbi:MAG TPA: methylase, partial [Sphingobium sp.]